MDAPPFEPSSNPRDPATSGSLTTARALILLQLLSRLLTFGLNQALVRLAPPEVFGTAAIQFDLICSTILFLSREGVRNALLRGRRSAESKQDGAEPESAPGRVQDRDGGVRGDEKMGVQTRQWQDARLAAVPLYASIPITLLTLTIYLARLPTSTSVQLDFYPSLALYVFSAILELSIEPLYIHALRSDPPRIRVRVQAEGGMAIARAVVTVGSILAFSKLGLNGRGGERALLAFAFGQMAGAGWLAGRYVWAFGMPDLSIRRTSQLEPRFDAEALSLTIANVKQSFIKHLLTEGDRIAVGAIYPLENQGGYAVAMNYGSLIARIIFQPIEETLFLHFTSHPTTSLLPTAIRLSLHLPLIIYTFLPPLLPAILPILLPSRYLATDTPAILAVYLQYYIPLLSLNGLLEAYHTATATPAQVARQVKWMIAGSGAFAGALYVLRQVQWEGGEGLVYASCTAMGVRIVYAYLHARGRLGGKMRVGEMMPHWMTPVVLGVAGGVLRWIQRKELGGAGWKGRMVMIGTGGVLGLLSVGVIGWQEYKRWKKMQV